MMKLIITKDYSEMCKHASRIFAAQLTLKPNSVLGLATGSTPVGIYKELIQMVQEGRLDFSEAFTVNLDEYEALPQEHDQSYRYFMDHQLFNHINISLENTFVPNGTAADLNEECDNYDALVEGLGGVDIQLLGIGNNGHIGFNEPCNDFSEATHVVDLTASTIEANARFFPSMEDVPKRAITMGIGTIMRSRKIVLVANGKAKAKIISDMFEGPITPLVPASVLRLHPDVTIIVDEEAASKLLLF